MNQDGVSKDDVKVPEGELGEQIQAGFEEGKDLLVTIIAAMGEEQVRILLREKISFHLTLLSRPSPSRKRQKEPNHYAT